MTAPKPPDVAGETEPPDLDLLLRALVLLLGDLLDLEDGRLSEDHRLRIRALLAVIDRFLLRIRALLAVIDRFRS
jgi:hypothetical protein